MSNETLKATAVKRSCGGAQPLFWGAAPDGRFMLGSDPIDLAACDPTPTSFPAGALLMDDSLHIRQLQSSRQLLKCCPASTHAMHALVGYHACDPCVHSNLGGVMAGMLLASEGRQCM